MANLTISLMLHLADGVDAEIQMARDVRHMLMHDDRATTRVRRATTCVRIDRDTDRGKLND